MLPTVLYEYFTLLTVYSQIILSIEPYSVKPGTLPTPRAAILQPEFLAVDKCCIGVAYIAPMNKGF